MKSPGLERIVVIGTTSSGKSTLARRLAARLSLDYIELDALHFGPDWLETPEAEFRSRVDHATRASRWVTDGNYRVVRDILWPRAETILWLDYSLPVVFWRLSVRTIRRALLREELWSGNRENFWWHLKLWSDESLYHWLFKTYWRNRREYRILLSDPKFSRLQSLRLKSPTETEDWLLALPDGPGGSA